MILPWMEIASREIGVREVSGSGDNARVLEYHAIGAPDLLAQSDSVPWCAAFVGWVLYQYGSKGTGKANARSYLKWGYSIPAPRVGSIAVLKRGNSDWQGHVGFVVHVGHVYLEILGGNQGDQVSIARYPRWRVLAYRYHNDFLEIPAPRIIT